MTSSGLYGSSLLHEDHIRKYSETLRNFFTRPIMIFQFL